MYEKKKKTLRGINTSGAVVRRGMARSSSFSEKNVTSFAIHNIKI
jgi:hypothetical protein